MLNSKHVLSLAIGAVLAGLAGSTFAAGSAPGTLSLTATVNTNCTVNSPTLTFNAIDPTAGVDSTGNATLSVTCTKSTTLVDIKLGPGGNQVPSGKRQLANGAVTIPYQLFTDNTFTTLWGDSTTVGIGNDVNSGFSAFTSAATPETFTVFGQILAADEDVAANTYTDSVAVTVDF
ncbi:MAG TPA: spore coat U domain-containing protein [Gammaproteobacteria bacterium]|nr:spore coat U domain-containing protein [Gammaproteobacteria bacterium]